MHREYLHLRKDVYNVKGSNKKQRTYTRPVGDKMRYGNAYCGGHFHEYRVRKTVAVCGVVCGGDERYRLYKRFCRQCSRLYSGRQLFGRRYRHIGTAVGGRYPPYRFPQKNRRFRCGIGNNCGRLCFCRKLSNLVLRKRYYELHYPVCYGRRRCSRGAQAYASVVKA